MQFLEIGMMVLFVAGVVLGLYQRWQRDQRRKAAAQQSDPVTITDPYQELRSSRWQERLAAVQMIDGEAHALDALLPLLSDPDSDVREAVGESLVHIGADARSGLEAALLEARNPDSRTVAARALGQIGERKSVPALIQALNDVSSWVRIAAAESLGQIQDRQAREPLQAALEDESADVREAAQQALDRIARK